MINIETSFLTASISRGSYSISLKSNEFNTKEIGSRKG